MAEKTSKKQPDQIQPAPAVQTKSRNPTGWRKWLYRLLAMTVVPAFLLVVLEGLLRLWGYGYPTEFFLLKEVSGQEVCTDNPDFGRRFFPPGLTRTLSPMVMSATKPGGTYRIFILGESAAMGYPDPAFHFGRILQTMLQERYPDTRFEIVNTGMTAINSHVVLPIARDCAEHQPDLFVVYMGNNEVVGPYGASGVLGPFTPNLPLIRSSIQVKETRTGQLLASLLRRATDSGKTPRVWNGMLMYLENQVPADDVRLTSVYDHFARNLQDICAVGQHAGAKVVVCTVASNLKDSAPFASVPTADLTTSQVAEWKKRYEEGIRREATHEPAAAVACYRQALEIDDKVADLHFRLARCLATLKQPDDARPHYVLARDLDALRFRADSRLNETIRTTAKDRQADGVYLADVEQAFAKASPDGIPGEDLLYEHVHLTFQGNYWLAHTVLEQMDHILPDSVRPRGKPATPFLSLQDCKARLPFTEWNLANSLRHMAGMAGQPPFTQQLDHAERQERWRRQLDQLTKRLESGGYQEALAAYRRVREGKSGDFYFHKDFVLLLYELGYVDEAYRHAQEGLELVPHDAILHGRLAEILEKQGRLKEALAAAAESVRLKSDDPQFHNLMGRLLIVAGKPDQAAASLEEALKLVPDSAPLHVNLGDALALQKQTDRAIAEYREALRLNPSFSHAHLQLGRLYISSGDRRLAQHHLQEALGIDPKQALAHAELSGILANQGNIAEAIAHMEEAVRLRPGWQEAAKALQALRSRLKKSP